jgi:hypothetical protein
MSHRIYIEPISLGDRGYRYRVAYAGSELIESTWNPEYDACRALLALGIVGRLEIWRAGTTFPASSIDIERGARWTVLETEREVARVVRWRSFAVGESQDAVSARAVSPPAGNFRDSRTHPRLKGTRPKITTSVTQPGVGRQLRFGVPPLPLP